MVIVVHHCYVLIVGLCWWTNQRKFNKHKLYFHDGTHIQRSVQHGHLPRQTEVPVKKTKYWKTKHHIYILKFTECVSVRYCSGNSTQTTSHTFLSRCFLKQYILFYSYRHEPCINTCNKMHEYSILYFIYNIRKSMNSYNKTHEYNTRPAVKQS